MSDRRKEAEEKMAKAIFISADCWLCVFDLLVPSQLGLGISMISHRFNFYVDEQCGQKWSPPKQKAFASASSPVNFIFTICFPSSFADSVVPFTLTNEFTREQLALKKINNSHRFLLTRCPSARDESKWTKWEKEAIDWQFRDQWNRIDIQIYIERQIGDGLLDEIPGPSDQQQK